MKYATQREAYGQVLAELGRENSAICALDADLGNSTRGRVFAKAHPERYFEMGIAEQNMMSVAAGLALAGKIPFVSSFAVFVAGRAYDQFRQTIAIAGLNVKVCGSSAGLSDYGDGSTHQSVEDLALMRAIPGVTVLSPADAAECAAMLRYMAGAQGPMYIRVNRNPLPDLYDEAELDIQAVPNRMDVLREGGDVALLATGVMVSRALEAAKRLEARGISAKVVNVSVIKPLNVAALTQIAASVKAVVTAEEHSVVGGLGSAVAEALCGTGRPMAMVGIQDRFGTSARGYEELLAHYGLTPEAVEAAAAGILARLEEGR